MSFLKKQTSPAQNLIGGQKQYNTIKIAIYIRRDYEDTLNEDGTKRKPWISLSGDDDGNHYILIPTSEDKDDFIYETLTLIQTGGTTAGTQAVVDIDGDGYTEIVSAGFSVGKVYVHSFSNASGTNC